MSALVLALETGGTKLVAAAADAAGRLIEVRVLARPPNNRAPHSLAMLIDAARHLLKDHAVGGRAPLGIGFGYGGQVARREQRVLRCPHEEGWEDIDVREVLQRELALPSALENDCKLAALAEATLGAGRDSRTVVYVTVGTGIGGGIVRDSRIVAFSDAGEAEIGHITVMPQGGWPCGCGKTGCLESVAAGPGLVAFAGKLAAEQSGDWKENPVAQRALHDARFTAKDLLQAYEQDEMFASVVLRAAAAFFGQALASVIQVVNPDVIVFGGGVGSNSERLVRSIAELTEPNVMPSMRGHCRFVRSQLRERVVTQGAALLALQHFRPST
jgi:glucokinase